MRKAVEADSTAIAHCVNAAYSHYIDRIGKPPGPMLDDYARRIADDLVFVAEDDNTVVGVLIVIEQEDSLLLDNVAVLPDCQGTGLGKRLMALAESEARRLGFDEIELYTHEKMTESLAIYLRLGYREVERKTVNGYSRIYMRKQTG